MPLMFDMPLEKLRTYQGTNPRPGDFDAYWERALAEMRATDPQVELVPATFNAPPFAECFDMYFNGVGGARIHAKLLRPRGAAAPHPALLMFHGYSGNSGDWADKLGYVANGFTVAALDARGQGGLSVDASSANLYTLHGHIVRGIGGPADGMMFRQIFLDTAEMARIVMDLPDVDPTRVGATGGSQGGGLTLACASLEPRVRRAAPAYPFLSDYKRVWDMDQAKDAYLELREYFRKMDPLHECEGEVFAKLGYIDVQHLAHRIRGEVLMGTGLMDTVCPPSTQFAAYNKITAKKSMRLYPDYAHEALPGWSDAVYQFMQEL